MLLLMVRNIKQLFNNMKTESRTIQQNNAYFLFQEQIAYEMNSQSISLANLVAEIQPKPTKTSKKDLHSAYIRAIQV